MNRRHRLTAILSWLALVLWPVTPQAWCASEELRGWWVDAFHPGFKNPAEVRQLVADARRGHFNALFVQVRKRGDAYYHSTLEPAANDIAPGYDPLADLLLQAHSGEPRLEIHAWVVVYPVWNDLQQPPSAANHVARAHPDWLTQSFAGETWDGPTQALDPGHPAVQQHLFDVVMDLVTHYDLDGVQLDYVRYGGIQWGYNLAAVRRFNERFGHEGRPAPAEPQWLQFRRDQVTALVRKVYLHAIERKPRLTVSAATICFAPGITNLTDWPASSAYADKLQDWRAWMEEGILDLNVAMAYFAQPINAGAWNRWSRTVKLLRGSRHAALGVGTYLNSLADSIAQLRTSRAAGPGGVQADGVVCYSYAGVGTGRATRNAFIAALTQRRPAHHGLPPVFATAARPPGMPWKTSPHRGHLKGFVRAADDGIGLDGASLELEGAENRNIATDATGFFGAVDLPPGEYRVKVSAPGREPSLAMCIVRAGQVSTQDIVLGSVVEPPGR